VPELKVKMVTATVAPGHTVEIGEPRHRWVEEGGKRTRIPKGTQRSMPPGSIVELPEDEYKHLLRAGFLLDPSGLALAPMGSGPVYDRDLTQQANPAGVGLQNGMIEGRR
jgi:hypothetical protein